jgi:hypothetical protein
LSETLQLLIKVAVIFQQILFAKDANDKTRETIEFLYIDNLLAKNGSYPDATERS